MFFVANTDIFLPTIFLPKPLSSDGVAAIARQKYARQEYGDRDKIAANHFGLVSRLIDKCERPEDVRQD
jgi:hypothetical protein